MEESILEYVIARLAECNREWPSIAESSGVPLSTLRKVARREVSDPRVKTVEKLARHFRKAEAA